MRKMMPARRGSSSFRALTMGLGSPDAPPSRCRSARRTRRAPHRSARTRHRREPEGRQQLADRGGRCEDAVRRHLHDVRADRPDDADVPGRDVVLRLQRQRGVRRGDQRRLVRKREPGHAEGQLLPHQRRHPGQSPGDDHAQGAINRGPPAPYRHHERRFRPGLGHGERRHREADRAAERGLRGADDGPGRADRLHDRVRGLFVRRPGVRGEQHRHAAVPAGTSFAGYSGSKLEDTTAASGDIGSATAAPSPRSPSPVTSTRAGRSPRATPSGSRSRASRTRRP